MDVMADFSLESVEDEEHLSEHIARFAEILESEGLEYEIGGAGTTVVGEIETVLDCIARCHQELGEEGTRVKSVLNLEAREEWPPGSIQTQAEKVRKEIEAPTPM